MRSSRLRLPFDFERNTGKTWDWEGPGVSVRGTGSSLQAPSCPLRTDTKVRDLGTQWFCRDGGLTFLGHGTARAGMQAWALSFH